jgi:hypothetical protein
MFFTFYYERDHLQGPGDDEWFGTTNRLSMIFTNDAYYDHNAELQAIKDQEALLKFKEW